MDLPQGRFQFPIVILSALLAASCVAVPPVADNQRTDLPFLETALAAHIDVLASDAYGGRAPGTDGEVKTLDYLAQQWQAAGLKSGTNDPAHPWFAPVEIARSVPETSTLRFYKRGKLMATPDAAAIAFTSGQRALLDKAPLLYVGKSWRSVDDLELTGRVAVMVAGHADEVQQRDALLQNGASAVLTIVTDDAELRAVEARRKPGFHRLADDQGGDVLSAYITRDAAAELLGENTVSGWFDGAGSEDAPQKLDLALSIEATSATATIQTQNLIARLPGSNPGAGAVLLMAHWDHFGTCGQTADPICNGAVDNASGLAMVTELAKRLAAGPPMERDVYFLATTAEEWGLLGARAFAKDPAIPLDSIAAAFNLDSMAIAPRGAPVAIVGEGLTPLDDAVKAVIRQQDRSLGNPEFAARFLQRQDGWVLLQRDVPTLMVSSAFADEDAMGRYTEDRYHLPSDEISALELGGAAQDLVLHLALVRHFANPALYSPRDNSASKPIGGG